MVSDVKCSFKPRIHQCVSSFLKLFSFMGFIASVIWIYSTANEIVNLLKVSLVFCLVQVSDNLHNRVIWM